MCLLYQLIIMGEAGCSYKGILENCAYSEQAKLFLTRCLRPEEVEGGKTYSISILAGIQNGFLRICILETTYETKVQFKTIVLFLCIYELKKESTSCIVASNSCYITPTS